LGVRVDTSSSRVGGPCGHVFITCWRSVWTRLHHKLAVRVDTSSSRVGAPCGHVFITCWRSVWTRLHQVLGVRVDTSSSVLTMRHFLSEGGGAPRGVFMPPSRRGRWGRYERRWPAGGSRGPRMEEPLRVHLLLPGPPSVPPAHHISYHYTFSIINISSHVFSAVFFSSFSSEMAVWITQPGAGWGFFTFPTFWWREKTKIETPPRVLDFNYSVVLFSNENVKHKSTASSVHWSGAERLVTRSNIHITQT